MKRFTLTVCPQASGLYFHPRRQIMEDMRLILSRHGFSFKKQFGQNFISDTNLLKSIVALAGVDKDTAVLEIGCGAGTLTRELSRAAKSVVGYESDKNRPIRSLRTCPITSLPPS